MSITSTVVTTERPAAFQPTRRAVPWSTVLPLAIVLAYADGFWMTSLRGAVGAMETTQSPFASWWRESTLVIPVFVVAVLGALMLAQRWFGPVLRRPRAVAATVLLIVAAGTIVGLAQIAAGSAYDYHLQSNQLRMMDLMQSMCTGNCLPVQEHDTLVTTLRGGFYVSRWLLLTNLVLVSWLVAMRGGRVALATTKQAPVPSTDASPVAGRRVTDIRLLLVAGLVGSAAIHAGVIPEHLKEWIEAGRFFVVLTAAELGVAVMLLVRPKQRAWLLAAAVISIGPLIVWSWSRATGLPFGPEAGEPEAIGVPDVVACLLEFGTLIAAVVLMRASGRLRQPAASAHVRALVLVAVLGVTLIGLAGIGPSWFNDGFSGSGMQMSATSTSP
jgi:hypothetical protein